MKKLMIAVFLGVGMLGLFSSEALAQNACQVCADPLPHRGDADNNCVINESDAVFILTRLFLGGVEFCNDDPYYFAADVNADNKLDISDPIYLLSFIHLETDPPASLCTDGEMLTWERSFGDEFLNIFGSVEVVYDQKEGCSTGYIFTGSTKDPENEDNRKYHIVRTDLEGNTVWEKLYSPTENFDVPADIAQTFENETGRSTGFIIAGKIDHTIDLFPKPRSHLLKIDNEGNQIWGKDLTHSFPPPFPVETSRMTSIRQAPDGGYVMTGTAVASIRNRGYLIKTDEDGNQLWEEMYYPIYPPGALSDLNSRSSYNAVSLTSDGGYVVVGTAHDIGQTSSNSFPWIGKVHGDGSLDWSLQPLLGTGGLKELEDVQQTSDGGYIAVGIRSKNRNLSTVFRNLYLVKFEPLGLINAAGAFEGQVEWEVTYEASIFSDDDGLSVGAIREDVNGDYIIAGAIGFDTPETGRSSDAYLAKFSSEGELLWEKTFGGDNVDSFLALEIAADGGYIISGFTRSFGEENGDYYIIKTDADGNK